MVKNTVFINRCVRETLSGLREGLSLFSGQSRAAVIFSISPEGPLFICDPRNLLRGYEPKLKAIFYENDEWCSPLDAPLAKELYNLIDPQANLQLDGLISFGGSSAPVFYQMWFTDHHPNICSIGPTERWLEHAVLRFSHDIANGPTLYTGISGSFLKEFGTYAVHDYIIDKAGPVLGMDVQIHVSPILETILGISKTSEEGVRPYGSLTFIEPRLLDNITLLTHFSDQNQPLLTNYKHVRKLLQAVEHSHRTLISDGKHIIGIATKNIDQFRLIADFQGKFGFLSIDEEVICSFQDGSYSSDTHRAKLFEVEEALLDFDLDATIRDEMFKIIAYLVHNAEDKMFGCSYVIDLAIEPTATAGQNLIPPIDLRNNQNLELAAALSKVDGALHIRHDLHLYGFACLLDGHRVENENRARGARYNSALRFTKQHPETIVVVVSSDRPVSIFRQGQEIQNNNSHAPTSQCNLYPLLLSEWLESGEE